MSMNPGFGYDESYRILIEEELRVVFDADTVDGAYVRFVAEHLTKMRNCAIEQWASGICKRLYRETFNTRLGELLAEC